MADQMTIKPAETEKEIEAVRRLFREYEAFLGVDLGFQNFDEEFAGLPGKYARPDGDLLIGLIGNHILGCVAVRWLGDGVCEMKRLYVRPEARGTGLGRRLALEIIDIARELGYALMRLDTLDRLTEAMRLYETLGFRRTAPYYKNPLQGVVYWELPLVPDKGLAGPGTGGPSGTRQKNKGRKK
jgi:ribosomal protein S18 acetylase RimI-like enzyme